MAFTLKDAVAVACKELEEDAGRYFGEAGALSLGIGVIFGGIPYTLFDPANDDYVFVRGRVLVLTHECDVAEENDKLFNSDVIFAPLASFDAVYEEMAKSLNEGELRSYVAHLSKGNIRQLFYLPPWKEHPNGSVIYFNRISNTHVSRFSTEVAAKLGALTGYSYRVLLDRLTTHLMRYKSEDLPLSK